MAEALRGRNVRGVLLAGEAGVGKTRIAQEALAVAHEAGWATEWAVGTQSAASIPFGALSHLLPAGARRPRDRLDLLRTAVQELTHRPDGRRLVLAVDDAHLLDDASATLVHQLAEAAHTFLIVTVRTGEPVPDGLGVLWKDGVVERLDVAPLPEPAANQLLSLALDGPIDGVSSNRLWRTSQGNALYLRELVTSGIEDGTFVRTRGVWRLLGAVTPGPRLSELIEARLGRLDEASRRGLELLAFGEPLGVTVLEHLVPPDALERAERAGLITISRHNRRSQARLAHPLYGAVLRRNTPLMLAPYLHQRLVAAVQTTPMRRADDMLRIAAWSGRAGTPCDTDMLTRAARHAMQVFDYELAEDLGRRAVEAGGGLDAHWALGDAVIGRGGSADGEAILAALVPLSSDVDVRVQLALRRAENLTFMLGRADQAREVLAVALDETADPHWRAELEAFDAMCLMWSGRTTTALRVARQAVQHAQDHPPLSGLVVGGLTAALCGRSNESLSYVERGEALVAGTTEDHPFAPVQLPIDRCIALLLAGRALDAEGEALARYDQAVQRNWTDACALWALWLGIIARHRGQPRTALRWLRMGIALFCEHDRFGCLPSALSELAHAAAVAGDTDAAAGALREAEVLTGAPFALFLENARPWVGAARGDGAGALRLAIAAADCQQRRGEFGWAATSMHDIARLGDPRGASDRLASVIDQVDGEAVRIYTAHAAALAGRDGKRLDDVSARFEELGLTLLAAEAASEAARVHRGSGRMASASASTGHATRLAALCEGARTPALLLLDPLPLTARERQIAGLAASGLSSKAIAEALVVSVRTVDNHLSHIYAKTGVAGRTHLAGIV